MEQKFKEWLLQQTTQIGAQFSKVQAKNLCKDLRETIPNWESVEYENLFNITDVNIINSLYKRCLKDGDLKELCKKVGNNRPSNALGRYKEFLENMEQNICTWVKFFSELGNKISKKSPEELSKILANVFNTVSQSIIPTTIDPFSFFSKIISIGSHHRSNDEKDKRRIVLSQLKSKLKIQSALPKDYAGMPTSMAMNVFLFPFDVNVAKYKKDVLLLCALFKQSQNNDIKEDLFNQVLKIQYVGFTKLTQALFWTNAKYYFTVDRNTKPYFELEDYSEDYQGYQQILKNIKQYNKSHCQLSYDAWTNKEKDEKMQKTINLLKYKKQIILQGSPGTGKTMLAKNIAEQIAPDNYKIIQFHPAYSYEDFVRGIVAKTTDKGVMYETQNKVLAQMAQNAIDNSSKKFVLIIDEINRANLAAVLGELIYALEYRGEAVESMYAIDGDREIILPENLYIIGTMNTADRSVGHIDYAIRRRFAFVNVNTDKNIIPPNAQALFAKIETLFNEKLSEEFALNDVMIGHSYFLNYLQMEMTLEYEIKPILLEYLKDGVLNCEETDITSLDTP